MSFLSHLRRARKPRPSPEALAACNEVKNVLRPRGEAVARERTQLLRENNYTARIRALYQGEA